MKNSVFNFAAADQPRLVKCVPPGGASSITFSDEFSSLPVRSPKAMPERPHPADHDVFLVKPGSPRKAQVIRPQPKDTCGQLIHDIEHAPKEEHHQAKKHAVSVPKETNDLLDMNRKAEQVQAHKKHVTAHTPQETNDLLEAHVEPTNVAVTHFSRKHINPIHGDCPAILNERAVVPASHPSRRMFSGSITKDHFGAMLEEDEKKGSAPESSSRSSSTSIHSAKKHTAKAPKETNDLLDQNRRADPKTVAHAAKKHPASAPQEHNDMLEISAATLAAGQTRPRSGERPHAIRKHVAPSVKDCVALLADHPVPPAAHILKKHNSGTFSRDSCGQLLTTDMVGVPAPKEHTGKRVYPTKTSTAKIDKIGGLLQHAEITARNSPYAGRKNLGGQQTFIIA